MAITVCAKRRKGSVFFHECQITVEKSLSVTAHWNLSVFNICGTSHC